MASVITGIIPKQGFEIVRDQIGIILLTELAAQKTRQMDSFPETIEGNIGLESVTPADSANPIQLNIVLDSATYGQITQKDAQGRTLYFIDIFTSGKNSGDSTFRRDKFLGMVMFIFRSAQYRTMGLAQGLIGGTYVESFATLDPHQKEDSNYTSFARVQLAIRIQEDAQAWSGIDLLGQDSTVKLDLTEKGYKFVFNNS